ncbi:hypothetical protein GCK72_009017 [Caenorhabditis remanei]|uniref:Uncharacterized protein n=1 Tax=Caenorhabditis remanei TaxID=31234 RepID=A0A6A5H0H1_CAERE|nr:hypothetical protein GCK72_009017 [Caenorhabditis remanei]KAF1760767.1 hypothetical protein GCK72_009017 [Caenorhabditis remanei]
MGGAPTYLGNIILVGNDSINTMIGEADGAVSQKTSGLKDVTDDEWLEDVEFKVSVRSTDAHSDLEHNLIIKAERS